jgi:hypothetical protein
MPTHPIPVYDLYYVYYNILGFDPHVTIQKRDGHADIRLEGER